MKQRKTTQSSSAILKKIDSSQQTPEKNPEHTSSFLRKCLNVFTAPITALAALSQIVGAKAESVYLEDVQTNTQYMLGFNADDFPDLRNKISEYCQVLFNATPQAVYDAVGSPQCRSGHGELGPKIAVSIEATRQLAKSFQVCLTEAMKPMCDNYFDRHNPPIDSGIDGSTVLVIVLCVTGAAAIGGLCCYLCTQDNSNYCPPPAYQRPRRYSNWNDSWTPSIAMTSINVRDNDSGGILFPSSPSRPLPPRRPSPDRGSIVVWNSGPDRPAPSNGGIFSSSSHRPDRDSTVVWNDASSENTSDSHWHSSVDWNSP